MSQTPNGKLKVTVSGFENNKGMARVLVFKEEAKAFFPAKEGKAFLKIIVPIENKSCTAEFDLPAGTYAVSVHHDENNDRKVNTNWIGIPNEGLGVSNDAKGNFGPPKFDAAKFQMDEKDKTIKINIVN